VDFTATAPAEDGEPATFRILNYYATMTFYENFSPLSPPFRVVCVREEISYCCTNYNPTTREQYTDSFLLSFYLSESYSRRARWLSLATEKDNFSCARHTGCGEDYRRGLIQSFFVLFSFSARRQNSRVPKIFFEKNGEFFSRDNTPRASERRSIHR
jgi:hypothetical protein